MFPINADISLELHETVKVTEQDIKNLKRQAVITGSLDDRDTLEAWFHNELTELIYSKIDLYSMEEREFDWDFRNTNFETLYALFVSENLDPSPPPEIPGQTTIEQMLGSEPKF